MRHHFGDFLDREDGYWTTIPNRERYAYRIGDVPSGSRDVTIITIGKDDESWTRVFTLPNLVELTLHEASQEQLEGISELRSLKRLRITHARPKTIDFIRGLSCVEELILEYVSGFNDLSPLRDLKRLRSLHMENLRRVESFDGLSGIESLRYLAFCGTFDWKQPVKDFEFLRGLPNLEVLAAWQFLCKKAYPALLPAVSLKNLKKVRIVASHLASEEYALLEVGLPSVAGANWGPWRKFAYRSLQLPASDVRTHLPAHIIREKHPDVTICHDGRRLIDDPDSLWFEFTGKSAGRVKCTSPKADAKCREFAERYEAMKRAAKSLIAHEAR
jgi:hypothetical protein